MSNGVAISFVTAAIFAMLAGSTGCVATDASPAKGGHSGGSAMGGDHGGGGAGAGETGSGGDGIATVSAGGQSGMGGTPGSTPSGTGGIAGANGGGPGTVTSAACPAASVCDAFDTTPVGQVPDGWSRRALDGASVGASRERSFSGSQSLAIAVKGKVSSQAYALLRGAPLFPAADNHVFGRMMVYYETKPSDGVHWTNIQGEGMVANKPYRAQYRMGGQGGKLMLNYEAGVPSDCFQHSGLVFPVGKWACFQWEFNGPKNEIRFWYEGQELESLHVDGYGQGCVTNSYKDPWIAPKFDTMLLGWQNHQDATPQKMFIDDVVVGSSPSPCPAIPKN